MPLRLVVHQTVMNLIILVLLAIVIRNSWIVTTANRLNQDITLAHAEQLAKVSFFF